MRNLTNIKIHGILAEQLGQSEWKLAVKSVGDAVRGIQCNSKKFYSQLLENDKKNIRYRKNTVNLRIKYCKKNLLPRSRI